MPAVIVGTLTLLISNRAYSQPDEQNAYCTYVMQEAMAQGSLMRTPNAVTGLTKSYTGTPPQLYWGISSSLSNYSKAKFTMDVARTDCELHRASTGAALHIQYALAKLESEALRHRAGLIRQAIEELDGLINHNLTLVELRNVTRPMVYSMQSVRARLVADRRSTESKLAVLYVPDGANDVPLKGLVAEKQRREAEARKSLVALKGQNNWDIKLEGGGRKPLTPFLQNAVEPYGDVMVTYNFGSRGQNTHLEKAAAAYTDWKKMQEGDVVQNAQVLEEQILQSISVHQAELKELQQEEMEIDNNLQRLVGLDTPAALGFINQLAADKLLLEVEVSDAGYRLRELRNYLKENF